jgi:hypothetical protein
MVRDVTIYTAYLALASVYGTVPHNISFGIGPRIWNGLRTYTEVQLYVSDWLRYMYPSFY